MDIAKTTFTRQFYLTTSDYESRSTDSRKKKNHVHVARHRGIWGQFVDRLYSLTNWQTIVCNF